MSFRNLYLQKQAWPNAILQLISRIQEYKGKQALFQRQLPEILDGLRQVAIIQSVESSNRIEGIIVSEKRIPLIVHEKAAPRDRSEAEVSGYRDALEMIHESADFMRLSPGLILQLHGGLMKYVTEARGKWKSVDNYIKETLPSGEQRIRFVPVSAWQTPDAIQELVTQYKEEIDRGYVNDLILIAAFILDFLCIHPFADGNGRMARLLTLLLLYQSGYEVGRYISLEKIVEDTRDQYYDTLYRSSIRWHEGAHNLHPWLEYLLSVILRAYQRFEERIGNVETPRRGWKKDHIRQIIARLPDSFTYADVAERCPGISRPTISRVLSELGREDVIVCVEKGRSARYEKKQTET